LTTGRSLINQELPNSGGRWCPPAVNRVKFNFDGAVFSELRNIGLGVVLRDHMGKFLAALLGRCNGFVDPLLAELFSLKKSIWLAKRLRYRDISLEGDSVQVVKMVNRDGEDFSQYGLLLRKSKTDGGNLDRGTLGELEEKSVYRMQQGLVISASVA
ncbi:hypothetical protein ACH5RR_007103, partial [Cinchona calisaya]